MLLFFSLLTGLIIYFTTNDSRGKHSGNSPASSGQPSQSGIFGNWIYGYVGNNVGAYQSIQTWNLDAYLPWVDDGNGKLVQKKENAALYLGTGVYPTLCECFGCWTIRKLGKEGPHYEEPLGWDNLHYQCINFGGYGCCGPITAGGATRDRSRVSTGCFAPDLPKSYCSSTPQGPNVVWDIPIFENNLPPASLIWQQGFNTVSLDIEGVATPTASNKKAFPTNFAAALNNALKKWGDGTTGKPLTRIVTFPGNGVKSIFGGHNWFQYVEPENYEYICLMYYGLGADTSQPNGGTGYNGIVQSLCNWISGRGPGNGIPYTDENGNHPTPKPLDSTKIILGFSFGMEDSATYTNVNGQPRYGIDAYVDLYNKFNCGGVTRWVYRPQACNTGNYTGCSTPMLVNWYKDADGKRPYEYICDSKLCNFAPGVSGGSAPCPKKL